MALRKWANTPLSNNYRPKCDALPELGTEEAIYYSSLIGVLRWMVEIGRIDITYEVSMMSRYIEMPREGSCSKYSICLRS